MKLKTYSACIAFMSLMFFAAIAACAQSSSQISTEQGIDRPGHDYKVLDLTEPDVRQCQAYCVRDQKCKAYTFVKPGVQDRLARCYLKLEVPSARPNTCCVSGVKTTSTARQPSSPNGSPRQPIAPSDTTRPQQPTEPDFPTRGDGGLLPHKPEPCGFKGPEQRAFAFGKSKNVLEVRLSSGEWKGIWKDSTPLPLTFRWRTENTGAYDSVWRVRDEKGTTVATGNAGKPPTKGHFQFFTINFQNILGNNQQRPLNYYVQVATCSGRFNQETQFDKPSEDVLVSLIAPGETTRFTVGGLRPDLYNQMWISIDLQTLKIRGDGSDEDPYLLIAIIYADGENIVPEIDFTLPGIHFPTSTVHIDTPPKTHENVPGGDAGDNLPIPPSTGHFERVIKPIGLEFAKENSLNEEQKKSLRKNTQVGILVIGFEEDAVPSTDVIDASRDMLVKRVREELTAIIRSLKIPLKDGKTPKFPEFQSVVQDLKVKLKEELTDYAESEGIAEFTSKLGIHAWPAIVMVPGSLNPDDYIGHGVAVFNYQQIMDAGTGGLPISMSLHQNCKCKPGQRRKDEDIYYIVEGRIRFK